MRVKCCSCGTLSNGKLVMVGCVFVEGILDSHLFGLVYGIGCLLAMSGLDSQCGNR